MFIKKREYHYYRDIFVQIVLALNWKKGIAINLELTEILK